LRRRLGETLRELGMTGPQFGVLLGAWNGSNVGDIAEQMLTDPTSIGRTIDRMETAGLVERYRQPPDRRVVWVRLRPAGREMLADALPKHVVAAQEMLGFLDTDSRATLVDLLTEIRNQLDKVRSSETSTK